MKSLFISKIIFISIVYCNVLGGIGCASISSTVATSSVNMTSTISTAVTPSPSPSPMPSSTSVTANTSSGIPTESIVSSNATIVTTVQPVDSQPLVNCDNATMEEINKLQLGGCPVVMSLQWLPGQGPSGSSTLKIDCLLSLIIFVIIFLK